MGMSPRDLNPFPFHVNTKGSRKILMNSVWAGLVLLIFFLQGIWSEERMFIFWHAYPLMLPMTGGRYTSWDGSKFPCWSHSGHKHYRVVMFLWQVTKSIIFPGLFVQFLRHRQTLVRFLFSLFLACLTLARWKKSAFSEIMKSSISYSYPLGMISATTRLGC